MKTYLKYDDAGFIVGINRMKQGIDNVHEDTQEIIRLMQSQAQISNTRLTEIARAVQSQTHKLGSDAKVQARRQEQLSRLQNQSSRIVSRDDRAPTQSSSSTNAAANNNAQNTQTQNRERLQRNISGDSTRSGASDAGEGLPNNTAPRLRDANGRFISQNSSDNAQANNSESSRRSPNRDESGRFTAGSSSAIDRLADKLKGVSGGASAGGVDPVLDSLKEAKDLLSPIGRAGKLAFGAVKMPISKLRTQKRREPLPDNLTRHNRENEKLLDKIWKAILKNGGGGGGGGLGGLFGSRDRNRRRRGRGGRVREFAGRGLKALGSIKGLGALAALAGAGGLALNWKELNKQEKGEQVGSIAGGGVGAIAGGVIGSFAGPIGTVAGAAIGGWIGSEGGEILARTVTPYVSRWTDNLNRADLPKKMLATFTKGLFPLFSGASSIWDWVKNKASGVFGFGGGDGSEGGDYTGDGDVSDGVTQKANKAADIITRNALTKSAGYCARYVRQGLQQAGYDIKAQPTAKDYNNGALTDAGFSKIDKNSTPQKGDIMVFPAQGKHSAGHIQMYNGTQWVSDFKQNSAQPWRDVKNANYTMYRDLNGEKVAGSARTGGASPAVSASSGSRAKQAMDFFMSQGWTKAQAAGIVGNFHKETGGFAEDVISGKRKGDGGKAVGIAQWHPDRQRDFKNAFGKNLEGASFLDQLKFAHFELTRGKEQGAGKRLKKATTAAQAGAIVSQYYERPQAVEAEKRERAKLAEGIYRSHAVANQQATPPKAAAPKGSNIKAASSFMPASQSFGITPTALPNIPTINIPVAPKITERLDSGANKPIVLQASNDTISQNVSDRGLAHAITGGLGQDRWG